MGEVEGRGGMSGKLTARVSDLRDSAERAEAAAGVAGRAAASDALTTAALQVPGSDSATALAQVGTRWDSRLTAWRDAMRDFSDGLTTAADDYGGTDEAGAAAYAGLTPCFGLVPDGSPAVDLSGATRLPTGGDPPRVETSGLPRDEP